MQPIREPELLDPGRIVSDEREDMTADEHRDRARLYAQALHDSCEYGRQLWHALETVRGQLVRFLREDGRAAPVGPGDEAGWRMWMDTYAGVTSVLAGPHGDSGYGADEARQLARTRREGTHNPSPERPERRSSRRNPLGGPLPMAVLLLLAARGLFPRRCRRRSAPA